MSFPQSLHSGSVVPAQLSFLTIYNPAFGDTDETAYEQIFYFHSRQHDETEHQPLASPTRFDGAAESKPDGSQDRVRTREEQQNDQLRRVGLARGMVEFAK